MKGLAKTRDSNMELLRIFAMFLVMIFHIDFMSIDGIDPINPALHPINSFIRIFLSLASFTCVNIFVLLSGWYGIHLKSTKLKSFLFQVFFFSILSYGCFVLYGKENMQQKFYIFFFDAYWFIPIYISLCLISPILNLYVDNCSQKNLKTTILLLLFIQCCYGWISPQERGWNEGCSPISFINLYLIARYARLYPFLYTSFRKEIDMFLFFAISFIASIIVFIGEKYNIELVKNTMFKFTSPFTIIAALYFVLFFSKIKIYSKWINWIASSCFAVFLVHCFPLFNQYIYHNVIGYLYLNYNGFPLIIYILSFIIVLYAISIFIDKIRIYIYKRIIKKNG